MLLCRYDTQQAPVIGFCRSCGGEVYDEDDFCWYCKKEMLGKEDEEDVEF